MPGLDVVRLLGIVSQRLSDFEYLHRQRVIGNENSGPEGIEQLIASDEFAG